MRAVWSSVFESRYSLRNCHAARAHTALNTSSALPASASPCVARRRDTHLPRAAERPPSNIYRYLTGFAQADEVPPRPRHLEAWLSAGNPGRPRAPLPLTTTPSPSTAPDDSPTVLAHRAPAMSKKRRRMGRPAFRRPTSDMCREIFGLVWLLLHHYCGAGAPPHGSELS